MKKILVCLSCILGIVFCFSCTPKNKVTSKQGKAINPGSYSAKDPYDGAGLDAASKENLGMCSGSQEIYSKCIFQSSISSDDSFYSRIISNMSDCSDLSEIICYKKDDNKKVVILACVSKNSVISNSSNTCLTKNNELVLSKEKYSATRIGEVQIL